MHFTVMIVLLLTARQTEDKKRYREEKVLAADLLTMSAFHRGVSPESRGTVADCLVVLCSALGRAAALHQRTRVHTPAVHARLSVGAIVHGPTDVPRTGWWWRHRRRRVRARARTTAGDRRGCRCRRSQRSQHGKHDKHGRRIDARRVNIGYRLPHGI